MSHTWGYGPSNGKNIYLFICVSYLTICSYRFEILKMQLVLKLLNTKSVVGELQDCRGISFAGLESVIF